MHLCSRHDITHSETFRLTNVNNNFSLPGHTFSLPTLVKHHATPLARHISEPEANISAGCTLSTLCCKSLHPLNHITCRTRHVTPQSI